MAIDRDTVKYVANLARIELSDNELDSFTSQLDRILDYVQKLNTLDVAGLEPTSHVLEMKNIYREDLVKKSLTIAEALKNAPSVEAGLFKVPRIIDTET